MKPPEQLRGGQKRKWCDLTEDEDFYYLTWVGAPLPEKVEKPKGSKVLLPALLIFMSIHFLLWSILHFLPPHWANL